MPYTDPKIRTDNLPSGLAISAPRLTSPRVTGNVVLVTAATTLDPDTHAGRIIVFNDADGATITLPAATGSGNSYEFVVGVTATSNQHRVNVTGDDAMVGVVHVAQDGGDTSIAFEAGADTDQINMNGSTQGGIRGDWFKVTDILADLWAVQGNIQATGTEATPFVTGQVA